MGRSVLSPDYRMSLVHRVLYAFYGIVLLVTRPIRATINRQFRRRCVWETEEAYATRTWEESWRVLSMLDGLRTHPRQKRFLQMMLAEHVSDETVERLERRREQ